MAVNPLVKALQLPEGFTVRKVKGVLKVVPARKAAIAKEKEMFPAIQHSSGSGWQLLYVCRPSEEELSRFAEWFLFSRDLLSTL